jgi:hypothetical protein
MAKCGEHDKIQNYMNDIESQILRNDEVSEANGGRTCDQNDRDMPRRIMNYNPEGKKRRVGRHEVRWIGVVNNDKRKAGVRNWRTEDMYRD